MTEVLLLCGLRENRRLETRRTKYKPTEQVKGKSKETFILSNVSPQIPGLIGVNTVNTDISIWTLPFTANMGEVSKFN